jgi:hypothetical protein
LQYKGAWTWNDNRYLEVTLADDRRERAFYVGALAAPIVGHGVLAILPSPVFGVMAMSLNYMGLPYAVWGLLIFLWLRKQPIHRMRLAVLLAPISFFIVCVVTYAVLSFAVADSGNGFATARASAELFAPWVLGLGYLWVVVILLAWRVVRAKDAKVVKDA